MKDYEILEKGLLHWRICDSPELEIGDIIDFIKSHFIEDSYSLYYGSSSGLLDDGGDELFLWVGFSGTGIFSDVRRTYVCSRYSPEEVYAYLPAEEQESISLESFLAKFDTIIDRLSF